MNPPRDPPDSVDRQDSTEPLDTGSTPESDQPNVLEETDLPDEHEGAEIFDHDRVPVASDIAGSRIDTDEETEDVVELIDKIDPRLNREEPPV